MLLMIQSSKGRRGLLAIKSTLLKAKSKALLGRALGGLKISILKLFMGGDDDHIISFSSLICFCFCVSCFGIVIW